MYWSPKKRGVNVPKHIRNWKGDVILCYRCFQKLPINLINSAKKFAINFHPGTPKYPGSCALNLALLNNEKYFGTVTHKMNESFDSGEILFFDKYILNYKNNLSKQIEKSRIFSSRIFKKRVKTLLNKDPVKKNKKTLLWSKTAYTSNFINKFQEIKFNTSKSDFEKRIKWIHHENFPLYTIIQGRKFTLKI